MSSSSSSSSATGAGEALGGLTVVVGGPTLAPISTPSFATLLELSFAGADGSAAAAVSAVMVFFFFLLPSLAIVVADLAPIDLNCIVSLRNSRSPCLACLTCLRIIDVVRLTQNHSLLFQAFPLPHLLLRLALRPPRPSHLSSPSLSLSYPDLFPALPTLPPSSPHPPLPTRPFSPPTTPYPHP